MTDDPQRPISPDEQPSLHRETISRQTLAWSSSTEPVCAGCGGLGYFLLKVATTDPRWCKPQPCECKQRREQQRTAQALAARLRSERGRFADATLANFDWQRDVRQVAVWPELLLDGQPRTFSAQQQRKSLDAAQQALAAYLADPVGGVYLAGPYGSGKTHLVTALCNHFTAAGRGAQYVSTPALLRDLRGGIADHTTDARLAAYIDLDVLALDDFGTEYLTDWSASGLFDLINERYQAERITLVTSNYPLTSMPGRIGSRLAQMCTVIALICSDYRAILATERRSA